MQVIIQTKWLTADLQNCGCTVSIKSRVVLSRKNAVSKSLQHFFGADEGT